LKAFPFNIGYEGVVTAMNPVLFGKADTMRQAGVSLAGRQKHKCVTN
jgi:hypothetical protein